MYPIHMYLPVPPHPSVFFTLAVSPAREISKRNNKNKIKIKVKHSTKNIKTNKILKLKPSKQANKQTKTHLDSLPFLLLHCLFILSSDIGSFSVWYSIHSFVQTALFATVICAAYCLSNSGSLTSGTP